MHNIVVATDGSPCAEHAIDVAAMLTKVSGARLLILTVGGNVSGEELRQIAKAEGGTPDAVELLVNRILEQASERAGAAGVDNVQVQTAWGDSAEMVIARREHGDAIVVGRRGRGRLTGLLLGSVSQKLVALAPCMVIVVP